MNRGAEKPYLRPFARSLGDALPAAPTSIQNAADRLYPDATRRRRQWVENLAGGNVTDQATRYPRHRTEPRPPMVCVKLRKSVLVVFHLFRATELPYFWD